MSIILLQAKSLNSCTPELSSAPPPLRAHTAVTFARARPGARGQAHAWLLRRQACPRAVSRAHAPPPLGFKPYTPACVKITRPLIINHLSNKTCRGFLTVKEYLSNKTCRGFLTVNKYLSYKTCRGFLTVNEYLSNKTGRGFLTVNEYLSNKTGRGFLTVNEYLSNKTGRGFLTVNEYLSNKTGRGFLTVKEYLSNKTCR